MGALLHSYPRGPLRLSSAEQDFTEFVIVSNTTLLRKEFLASLQIRSFSCLRRNVRILEKVLPVFDKPPHLLTPLKITALGEVPSEYQVWI